MRYDDQLGRAVITVVDAWSGETIRRIPPEHALALATDLAKGAPPAGPVDAAGHVGLKQPPHPPLR